MSQSNYAFSGDTAVSHSHFVLRRAAWASCGASFGQSERRSGLAFLVSTLRPSGRSAYAGDDMSETHPPLVPEPPAPDTARPPLAEEKPDSESAIGRTGMWRSVHNRVKAFDRRRIREAAISAMIVVILAIGVVSNLPDSAIARAVYPLLRPAALVSGLDQNWSMFSPTPPQRLEYLEVHVVMASGADKVW